MTQRNLPARRFTMTAGNLPARRFTMTADRAEEIRRAIWAAHGWAQPGRQYTRDEEAEISAFWTALPGGTSFYDAVARMARGEHLKDDDGRSPAKENAMKKPTAADKKADALLAAAFEALPKRIVCPRCKRNRTKEGFGLRVMARDAEGLPVRIARQSWCAECRGR